MLTTGTQHQITTGQNDWLVEKVPLKTSMHSMHAKNTNTPGPQIEPKCQVHNFSLVFSVSTHVWASLEGKRAKTDRKDKGSKTWNFTASHDSVE